MEDALVDHAARHETGCRPGRGARADGWRMDLRMGGGVRPGGPRAPGGPGAGEETSAHALARPLCDWPGSGVVIPDHPLGWHGIRERLTARRRDG
jgi:hypothetical protein